MKHTVRETAENNALWNEFVEQHSKTPELFYSMTIKQKMGAIITVWPEEIREDDLEALSMIK